jgi:ABC-type ATPase involved in cell division
MLLAKKNHIFLTGNSGTGKSAMIANLLKNSKETSKIDSIPLIFSG